MDWLETKYINLLSSRLQKFKRRSNVYNFRCPICGDSATNQNKARGVIFEKNGKSRFYCHNCNASMPVPNFIKAVDESLYQEYKLERIRDSKTPEQIDFENFVDKMKKPVFMKEGPLKGLKKVSQLSPDDPIKQFVVERKIPNEYHSKLFSCPNFRRFVNTLVPGKFEVGSLKHDETRLIIPFFTRDKTVFALQGRALGKNQRTKYITIVLDDSVPKIFNLELYKSDRPTYVFEGPIDSMFIPNSIATAGGDLVSAVRELNKSNLIICYDNEPRSTHTIKKMNKAIENGYSVCVWPDTIRHKDINDMILAGIAPEYIKSMIDENTYNGLQAKLALSRWSRT